MSQNITMNTYESLKRDCEAVGLSLAEACRLANVDGSSVRRWKKREPKTLKTLSALRTVIVERKNTAQHETV